MSASDAIEVQALLRAGAPRAPDALRERVLALEPRRVRAPSRRLLLVVVPVAVAIAVGAALVHGLLGSGSGTRKQPVALPAARAHAPGTARAGALATPSIAGGSSGRLQHTDASLQVRVPDVKHLSDATSAATRIVTSLGGYAQSVVYRTPPGGGGAAYLELRVPAQRVRTAIAQLAALGTLVSQRLSVEDLQHLLEVDSAQIDQLRREIAALQKALRNPSLPDAQRVLLEIKLADAKLALSQRLHARGGTVASGTTARISLVVSTQKSLVVPHHRGRLGRMVHSAVGFLALEGTIALYALIVLSPIAVVVALAWTLARARRRRDEQRLLAA